MKPAGPPPCVLLNPHAQGGRVARLWPVLQRVLPALDPQASLRSLDTPAEAARVIGALPPGTRVVAVGGDGTLHRWLPALLAAQAELAVVPMGNGNDVGRALGLVPLRTQEWVSGSTDTLVRRLAHALRAPARAIDLGRVEWTDADGQTQTRPFISSLTVGFDSAVVRRTLDVPSGLRGLPRYLWATLGELVHLSNWPLTVVADGATVHQGAALMASSLNTPTFGAGMPAAPEARIDDGQLDLLLAGRFGRLGALVMLPRLLTGTHRGHARVRLLPYRELSITCPSPVPAAADGEWLGLTRALRVAVQPAALRAVRQG